MMMRFVILALALCAAALPAAQAVGPRRLLTAASSATPWQVSEADASKLVGVWKPDVSGGSRLRR